MKIIKYGFFGEDEAQRISLTNYLQAINTETVQFIEDESFGKIFKALNKKQVDTQFAEACQRGLTEYQQDCFFVGRNLDTFEPAAFQQKLADMQLQAGRWLGQTVFLIPVQCIEHWLWYLKWHEANPGVTKNISIELKTRQEAKQMVYGSRTPSTKHSTPIVSSLSDQLDIEWLCSRSVSFNTFHRAVESFLARG